jgi:hypothetical protein
VFGTGIDEHGRHSFATHLFHAIAAQQRKRVFRSQLVPQLLEAYRGIRVALCDQERDHLAEDSHAVAAPVGTADDTADRVVEQARVRRADEMLTRLTPSSSAASPRLK